MDSTFTFLRHEFLPEQGSASFFFELQTNSQTYIFREKISFPKITSIINVQAILDNLLLMLGISYYKLTCAKKIQTPTISLTKDQANFWNIVYTKGLGEFFYKNNIDFRGLINFPYKKTVILSETKNLPNEKEKILRVAQDDNNRSLLLFGGGKDSIVSGELLKKHNKPFTAFVVNPTKIHEETLSILGCDTIIFTREIDSQLFELNKQSDMHNGHVPATAIIDFLAVLASALYGYDAVIASNEQSANYGNVTYLGEEINHQWSKSEEFEKMLQQYITKNISDTINYFSLLRPYHEIKIVEMFITYPQYFPYFSSCNKNFLIHNSRFKIHDSRWCCSCPKCLFIFMLMSAFLPKEKIVTIFGKNLYENTELLSTFKALLGITATKPFECVGTPEESELALTLAHNNHSYDDDLLMQFFIQEVLPNIPNQNDLQTKLLKVQNIDTIPQGFQEIYETQ